MDLSILVGIFAGFVVWVIVLILMGGIYTVDQNERAIKTTFGRAPRLTVTTLEDPISANLNDEEKQRYKYPQVRVIMPGGPYFKWPWERCTRSRSRQRRSIWHIDPERPRRITDGTVLEAVTKDQLNTGLTGQIRYQVSERNLYAYLFGVNKPIAHVMGYFVSVLRERIATFEARGRPMPQRRRGRRSRAFRSTICARTCAT